MKKILLLLLITSTAHAQDIGLKSILSFKAGVIGGWVSLEQPISDKLLIHAEFGQELGFYANLSSGGDTEYIATNTLSLEPRYYYNREKRKEQGKKLKNNAGNYLALELQHAPDWMTYSNDDNVIISKSTSIIPKIGMRRSIANAFTFELAGGVGYQFNDTASDNVAVALDLKLGFLLYRSRW